MTFDKGLSKQMRLAGAPRTPGGDLLSENSLTSGLLVGEVMDDQDDQRAGRLWVQIPGYTSRQVNSPNVQANWRGTAPDRKSGQLQFDDSLRRNWVLCQPLFSSMGSDQRRADYQIDGRNSYQGDVNSYGQWSQPRIGDQVGILFVGGDSNTAFYVGCLGKVNQGRMVPGNPGYNASKIVDGADEKEKTSPSVSIHGHDNPFGSNLITNSDTGEVTVRQDSTEKLPAHTQSRTGIIGGLGYDIHRGPGTSSSKRESPSYIWGVKTPGWNYYTEQYNTNMDNGQFTDDPNRYRYVNTTGHQFVMDDHPDHQLVRLRTSGGSQILLNDSGEHPYVYIGTSKGNVWLEFSDDGKVQLYCEDNLNIHAGKDINFTADQDINFEALGSVNFLARKDFNMTVGVNTNWAFNGPYKALYQANYNRTVLGDSLSAITGNRYTLVGADDVGKASGVYHRVAASDICLKAGGQAYFQGSGSMGIEAANIFLNSGKTGSPKDPKKSEKPKFAELTKKPDGPAKEEILTDTKPPQTKYLGSEVPQHQPWQGSTPPSLNPTTGRASATASVGGELASFGGPVGAGDYGATTPLAGTSATENRRAGASMASAKLPDPNIGVGLSSWTNTDFSSTNATLFTAGLISSAFFTQFQRPTSNVAVYDSGGNYQTDNTEEPPVLLPQRWLKPGEIAPSESFNLSPEAHDFIRNEEPFIQFPTVINGTTILIGRGHEIQIGDQIDSVDVTPDQYQAWLSGASTTTLTYFTSEDADTLFESDLSRYIDFVRANMETVYLTQGQFDALVSFAWSEQAIGNSQAMTQNVFSAMKAGRADMAQELMSQLVYVDGNIDASLVHRRQAERAYMNRAPNDAMDYSGTTWAGAEDDAVVQIGEFQTYQTIKYAIDSAAFNYGIDNNFLYAMAAQESGFNSNAYNTATGQTGLFQFGPDVSSIYGISGNETDPNQNADAAGRYIVDARATYLSVTGFEATDTDIYLIMFLGQLAGSNFIKTMQSTPDGSAVDNGNAVSPGVADAVPLVFQNYDGTPRTSREVYDLFGNLLTARMATF